MCPVSVLTNNRAVKCHCQHMPTEKWPIVSLLFFILSYNKHCQNSGEVTLRGADVPTIVYLRFGDVESPAQKCAKADYDKLALTK